MARVDHAVRPFSGAICVEATGLGGREAGDEPRAREVGSRCGAVEARHALLILDSHITPSRTIGVLDRRWITGPGRALVRHARAFSEVEARAGVVRRVRQAWMERARVPRSVDSTVRGRI